MSETRNGKIARLPYKIREELNCRLQDGEPGTQLVDWLNGRPEVQKILKDQFGGRPLSGQNLSEWKQGGYQDWLRHNKTSALVQRVRDEAGGLKGGSGGVACQEVDITEDLAVVLAAELGQVTFDLLKETDNPPERWRQLREVLHELGQFRRHNHRATRLKWDQRRWQREEDLLDEKARREEHERKKNKLLAPIFVRASGQLDSLAKMCGGGEAGRTAAAIILEVQRDLPPGSLSARHQSNPVKPGQTGSDPIKPDQTGSNRIKPLVTE